MLYVGVMSGTSCDGVDAVVVDFTEGVEIKLAQFSPYPKQLKSRISAVIADDALPISKLSQLDAELGLFYGQAINRLIEASRLPNQDIVAIGLHGQTVCHQPPNAGHSFHNTIQIGSAALTAQATGITTVANFRQMDVAYGGQGAPLAPVLHQHLFAQSNQHVVVMNLGGIANITSIMDDNVMGFDTGPANCLLDEWICHNKGENYDHSGQWAAQGAVNQKFLSQLLSEPYFKQKPPKSSGRELFNIDWLKNHLQGFKIDAVDVQRTLLQLTVETINSALNLLPEKVDQIVVCGGGAHNDFLLRQLNIRTSLSCTSSQALGVDPDFVEALLMAWMAKQNIQNKSLDLAKITGSRQPLVYGVKYLV